MSFNYNSVEAFGKISYEPASETAPELPDLNILVFGGQEPNDVYTHTAVCIQLDLDACGNSVEDALEQLQKSIGFYFDALSRQSPSPDVFAEAVIDEAFSPSGWKDEMYIFYRRAKRDYLDARARKSAGQTGAPRTENTFRPLFDGYGQPRLSPVAAVAV